MGNGNFESSVLHALDVQSKRLVALEKSVTKARKKTRKHQIKLINAMNGISGLEHRLQLVTDAFRIMAHALNTPEQQPLPDDDPTRP